MLNIDVHVCAQVFNLDIAPVSLEDQVVGYNYSDFNKHWLKGSNTMKDTVRHRVMIKSAGLFVGCPLGVSSKFEDPIESR